MIPIEKLPHGFDYPPEFLHVVELGILNLEPWAVVRNGAERMGDLRERFPNRRLVPFARRIDSDDIACWDISKSDKKIFVIHDYASPGWEQRDEFSEFNDWLRKAVEDLIEYEYDSGII
ncbi:hypothetical protein FEZ32_03670 [Acidipropionibacterium jensenii]|nr:hypothetical protein FEZ32_03670 [Acidipropionibacterium jensenii]